MFEKLKLPSKRPKIAFKLVSTKSLDFFTSTSLAAHELQELRRQAGPQARRLVLLVRLVHAEHGQGVVEEVPGCVRGNPEGSKDRKGSLD